MRTIHYNTAWPSIVSLDPALTGISLILHSPLPLAESKSAQCLRAMNKDVDINQHKLEHIDHSQNDSLVTQYVT